MTVCVVEIPVGDGTYWMGHKGVDLKDPERYARLSGCRVTVLEECPYCGEVELAGMCLVR